MKKVTLKNCTCGEKPKLVMLTEWPAQYQAQCVCGKTALGCYYGSDDKKYGNYILNSLGG